MAEPKVEAEERCSVLSRSRGDSMLGTAFERGGVLLVEIPGPWGHDALTASRFEADVAHKLIARAEDADLRTLAIRHPGRSDAHALRRWAVRPVGSALTYWGTYSADAELLDLPLDGSAGEPDGESSYLVCAHSKRDQCCAVFGRPIAAALEELRPGRVWECSHTGGHRFAPVVLALPATVAGGALYGRVEGPGRRRNRPPRPNRAGRCRRSFAANSATRRSCRRRLRTCRARRASLASTRSRCLEATNPYREPRSVEAASSDGVDYAVTVEAILDEVAFSSCGKPTPKPQLRPLSVRS